MKKITAFLVIAVLISATTMAFASGGRPHKGKCDCHSKHDRLNLTDEQKQALKERKKADMQQMQSSFKDMRGKEQALRAELEKENLDMDKIGQIHNEIKTLKASMLDARLNSQLQLRKILTAEQFKQKMKWGHQSWGGKHHYKKHGYREGLDKEKGHDK